MGREKCGEYDDYSIGPRKGEMGWTLSVVAAIMIVPNIYVT